VKIDISTQFNGLLNGIVVLVAEPYPLAVRVDSLGLRDRVFGADATAVFVLPNVAV
jgi:hypothetical protein